MTYPASTVALMMGTGGPTVVCYPGMKRGPENAAVTHAFVAGKETCGCGAIRLTPGTFGSPIMFPATLPTA